ncbi:hypothetical protein MKK75_26370 [Methylobacterium sp. J-030]|uniref:hypothetical protein n=1 Tax=Methylobacterium sp. J-030 TaxID=2836627 RepID=UPI001FBBA971|nr:hypothetical protein [Methylobacterium sp. J-030]MCJ2072275.1 hypothetical protein [Methylobacterium sp. J-030]
MVRTRADSVHGEPFLRRGIDDAAEGLVDVLAGLTRLHHGQRVDPAALAGLANHDPQGPRPARTGGLLLGRQRTEFLLGVHVYEALNQDRLRRAVERGFGIDVRADHPSLVGEGVEHQDALHPVILGTTLRRRRR